MSLTTQNSFVNKIFYKCVDYLEIWAEALGISYELINIIIFIIGYPLFVLVLPSSKSVKLTVTVAESLKAPSDAFTSKLNTGVIS